MQNWTPEEIEAVRVGFINGVSQEEIGLSIGRNKGQVCGKVKDLKEKGITPKTQPRIARKKNSPRIIEAVISDEEYPNFFDLDVNVCTILTSRRNQCKYPTPIEQAPSAMMRVCGNPVCTQGTPWRRQINENCQWCIEHMKIVYSPPHSWLRRQNESKT